MFQLSLMYPFLGFRITLLKGNTYFPNYEPSTQFTFTPVADEGLVLENSFISPDIVVCGV